MPTSPRLVFFLILVVALLGAGCTEERVQPQEPRPGTVQEVPAPSTDDLRDAEQRADAPGPPISESETPSPPKSPWD
ncbi:MAG: hypothetical protein Q8R16_02080 [bacterium]|nr:hypothetical protein [bacterium]